jgi:cytochrome oxidase Cu insertion factor (SCO1/SenC/PrrC family)
MPPVARRIFIAAFIVAAMVLILFLYWPRERVSLVQTMRPPAASTAAIGGPFTLTDTKGNTVTEATLLGHVSLIYFGFTFCPDICPVALENITKAIEMAGEAGDDVLPVFITVDPERDTTEAMAAYIAHFHPRFIGLRGTSEQTQEAVRSYRAFAKRSETIGPPDKAGGDYVMDHTGYTYLMGKDGKYITHFSMNAGLPEISQRLKQVLAGQ